MGRAQDSRGDHFRMQADACDSHCHVVGPREVFPFAPHRRDDPAPDATQAMLTDMHRRIGIARCVVVQSAAHGTDPSVTLDAVSKARQSRRGVVLIDPAQPVDLTRLHQGGIRGVRLNLVRREKDRERCQREIAEMSRVIAGRGWHLLLHMSAAQVLDLEPVLAALPVSCVIDHLGRVDPTQGQDQPAIGAILRLLALGHVFVKIAAIDKLSREDYPYRDICGIAAAFLRAAPRRVLWGTDWPHPDARGLRGGHVPDDQALADLIPSLSPDPALQQCLLVDNPAELYGFNG